MAAVTSLGGPTNSATGSTPTTTSSSGGLTPTTKLIIEVVAGVVGFTLLVGVLSCLRPWWKSRPSPPVPLPPHDFYGGGAGPETQSQLAPSIPLRSCNLVNIGVERAGQVYVVGIMAD
jgi:hypothetical protein